MAYGRHSLLVVLTSPCKTKLNVLCSKSPHNPHNRASAESFRRDLDLISLASSFDQGVDFFHASCVALLVISYKSRLTP